MPTVRLFFAYTLVLVASLVLGGGTRAGFLSDVAIQLLAIPLLLIALLRLARLPSLHGARGAGHIALAAPETDLPSWRAHLETHGVEIESEVRWPRGGRSLYMRDPAGNSVEIASPTVWGSSESLPDAGTS